VTAAESAVSRTDAGAPHVRSAKVTAVATRLMFTNLVLAFVPAACSTTTVVEPFYRPSSAQVDYAFASPNGDFGAYSRLQVTPLEIYYPNDAPQPSRADLDRLRAYFRNAFLEEIGDDYEIIYEPAADALRVQAQVIDFKLTGAYGEYEPSNRLRQLVANGELTFLMELQDSQTGRTLARAGDTTQTPIEERADLEASWESVRLVAQHWAALFRRFLDANLRGPSPQA
jgi:hypothetical protein